MVLSYWALFISRVSFLCNAALGLLRAGAGGNHFSFFIYQFFQFFFFRSGGLIGLLGVGIMRGEGRGVCMICMYVHTYKAGKGKVR